MDNVISFSKYVEIKKEREFNLHLKRFRASIDKLNKIMSEMEKNEDYLILTEREEL